MNAPLHFKTRVEFREWLSENCQSSSGIWLLFGKNKEIVTVTPSEALEEALCYGWIDGVMKKIDEQSYIKYFSARRKNSKWSKKNKLLIQTLEKQGLVTDFGKAKINEAKQNGQWENASRPSDITEKQIQMINELIKHNKLAYDNFQTMSPSVKKTYTRAYLDAKTDSGRTKRLTWMINRLEKNLKPM